MYHDKKKSNSRKASPSFEPALSIRLLLHPFPVHRDKVIEHDEGHRSYTESVREVREGRIGNHGVRDVMRDVVKGLIKVLI